MEIIVYDHLPESARELRTEVFVHEQGFSEELEFDEYEDKATHLVGFFDGKPAATSRFYFHEKYDAYLIGRIVVRKELRGKNLGGKIVTAAENEIINLGGKRTVIHAQLRAKGFYENLGYTTFGDIDLEEGVEHIMMQKDL